MLAGVTVVIAVVSEILVGAIEPASASIGMTPIFTGIIFSRWSAMPPRP